ncbi:MAG TPA: glycosyl hydrolase family 17 protein [bacterium]|nr:glycosyl hydrolase family 17 protein [bacterium]
MRARFRLLLRFVPALLLFPGARAGGADPAYSYPTRFLGVCYSPTHYGQADNSNPQTTLDAFAKDFPLVARKGFQVVRSYWLSSQAHYLNFIGEAFRNNLKVIVEVPVNPAAANNQQMIAQFGDVLALIKNTPEARKGQVMAKAVFDNYAYTNVDYVTPSMFRETVILALAGNENIPADPHDSNSLVSLKNSIQDRLTGNGFGAVAVSYCLQADVWAGDPSQYPNRRALLESLADGVPFLMTCYPFEWGMPIGQSVSGGAHSLQTYIDQVTGHYPALVGRHPVMFGETGWASDGTAAGSSPATLANESAYLSKVYTWMSGRTNAVRGLLCFEAFDESTKTGPEYERHFGLWTGGTPRRNGAWKQGLPSPPSLAYCGAAGFQANAPAAAPAGADTLELAGTWLPEGDPILNEQGLAVRFEGREFFLPPDKFFGGEGAYAYDDGEIEFRLTPNRVWRFRARADLENVDTRDGLETALAFGETVLSFAAAPRENSVCRYRAGVQGCSALETGGTPLPLFQVLRADLLYASSRDLTRGDVQFRFRLPPGAGFDPDRDEAAFSLDDHRRELAPGTLLRKKTVFYCQGTDRDSGGAFFLALDFGRGRGRIRFSQPGVWKLFSPHDGIDFFLELGQFRGGVRFDPVQRFNCRFQSAEPR